VSRDRSRIGLRGRRGIGALSGAVVVALASMTPGCYTTQLGLLRSGLDSLRTQVDTLTVRDSVAYRVVADTRRELASQRDLLLTTRASSGSTMQEMFDQMSRLEGKLDDVMHRFSDFSARATSGTVASPVPSPAPASGAPATAGPALPAVVAVPAGGGPTAPQLYDQATRDLTEGRYPLALQAYRELLTRFPAVELAPGAQYGVGECFFAQAAFDSAAVEYAKVSVGWPKSDRTPAALYKLGLCQDRLGRAAEARKTFEDLVRRFPAASESALARERLGAGRH
jgi:tol-pal system protein YbgF